MKSGLLKHSGSCPSLRRVAENLHEMGGCELLLALHLVGMSGEKALLGYLDPFLNHDDPSIRAEAAEAKAELCALGGAEASDD